jgi:hypothetical protein
MGVESRSLPRILELHSNSRTAVRNFNTVSWEVPVPKVLLRVVGIEVSVVCCAGAHTRLLYGNT